MTAAQIDVDAEVGPCTPKQLEFGFVRTATSYPPLRHYKRKRRRPSNKRD
jgi:hypothetical protein